MSLRCVRSQDVAVLVRVATRIDLSAPRPLVRPFDFENSILSEVENTKQSLQILHDFKSEKFLTDYLDKQKKYSLNFYEEMNL